MRRNFVKWRRFASRILAAVGAIVISPHPGQAQGPPSSSVPQDREMVSWVVLANTFVDLTLGSLRAKLDEIYPGQFLPPREKGNFVVDGPTAGGFFIQAAMPGAAGMFLLHNVPGLTGNSPAFSSRSGMRQSSVKQWRNAAGTLSTLFVSRPATKTPIASLSRWWGNSLHRMPLSWSIRRSLLSSDSMTSFAPASRGANAFFQLLKV